MNHLGETSKVQDLATKSPFNACLEPDSLMLPGLASDGALIRTARAYAPVRMAIVHPCDALSLAGCIAAREAGLIEPLIVAPRPLLDTVAAAAGVDLSGIEIETVADSRGAAVRAAQLAAIGRVAALMKGNLHTEELMAAVIDSGSGLSSGKRISHCFLIQVPNYARPFILTDAAINIRPDLDQKRAIAQNAIDLAHALGLLLPRVAVLCAVETISSKMTSTLDAAALAKMADRGQLIGALVDGPLAFDNAISIDAAREKGIVSNVAGRADILLVPDMEAGNMLAKELEFLGGAASAGIVLGATVPIVLTSRADSIASRVASCALAVMLLKNPR
jgi:phosphate acetyltransferase